MDRPGGVYRTMDLSSTFEVMPEVALALRPIIDVGDPDPHNAQSIPHLAAIGPLTVSTDHTVVRWRDLPIWDVNGYYRALGIAWPYRVTKRELRMAYQAMNGQEDEYATYAFKKLISTEFREFYDHRLLGQPVDDVYWWLEINRRSAAWAAKETMRTGELHRAEDFIPPDIREKIEQAIQKEEAPSRRLDYAPSNNVLWPFGYYLWDTRNRDDMTLSLWQGLLIKTFWAKGLRLQFAVGYFERASDAAAVRYRLSYPDVEAILLHSGQAPSAELADVVVATYHTHPEVRIAEPLFIPASPVEPH